MAVYRESDHNEFLLVIVVAAAIVVVIVVGIKAPAFAAYRNVPMEQCIKKRAFARVCSFQVLGPSEKEYVQRKPYVLFTLWFQYYS